MDVVSRRLELLKLEGLGFPELNVYVAVYEAQVTQKPEVKKQSG